MFSFSLASLFTCDYLVFRLFVRTLEDKVAECTWEGKIAINTIEFHPTASFNNALWFILIIGLMIHRQYLQLSIDAGNGTRISCIGTVQDIILDQHYDCSRASHLLTPWFIVQHFVIYIEKGLQNEL